MEEETKKLKLAVKLLSLGLFLSLLFTSYNFIAGITPILSPLGKDSINFLQSEKPLEKYSFERLANADIQPQSISIDSQIEENDNFASHIFSIYVEGKKVTGQINIPHTPSSNGYPIILMNRGFIEPETYTTGDGTRNAAAYFAKNGYITIAPDFLGFGGSDNEDNSAMAARVAKPVTVLTILYSLDSLTQFTTPNINNLYMWGHSNGGQISLSILEILGMSSQWNKPLPTTIWAPVSKGFPYSILYYTDSYSDYGKALRKALFEFELEYDTDKYSIHSYLDRIDSPLQIHQGTADELIPTSWSQDLTKILEENGAEVTQYIYSDADHNLQPNWNTVVARDLSFFKSHSQ